MFDCSDDLLAYHNGEITLPLDDQREMSKRRNSNRDRVRDDLRKKSKLSVREFKSQGSYAMKTMTQHPKNDYDIDDGVYFDKDALVGPRGGEMSALDARWMVRDAVDDGSFSKPPEVRNNCVRVYYKVGYHVDMPVYRRVVTKNWLGQEAIHHELASSDWVRSDARNVTTWFEDKNNTQSPDETNGRQLRRIVRQIKMFARSRDSWRGQIFSGFGITKLVTECFRGDASREDVALYETINAIRNRLYRSLVVDHPVTPNATITRQVEDPKSRFLRDKLDYAIGVLGVLHEADCTRKKALHAWDTLFNIDWFEARYDAENAAKAEALSKPAILTSGLLKKAGQDASVQQSVQKSGGGTYA